MSLFNFWDEGENDAIFPKMSYEKRSLAGLNEPFRNEISGKMGRLQPDPKNLKSSKDNFQCVVII